MPQELSPTCKIRARLILKVGHVDVTEQNWIQLFLYLENIENIYVLPMAIPSDGTVEYDRKRSLTEFPYWIL